LLLATGLTLCILADVRSSLLEVLMSNGLHLVQEIVADAPVLDIAFYENIMFVSLDGKQDWIVEYRCTNDRWEKVDTDKWRITKREENSLELYWLESMRKKIGHTEDE
jgi:hypothetical protein